MKAGGHLPPGESLRCAPCRPLATAVQTLCQRCRTSKDADGADDGGHAGRVVWWRRRGSGFLWPVTQSVNPGACPQGSAALMCRSIRRRQSLGGSSFGLCEAGVAGGGPFVLASPLSGSVRNVDKRTSAAPMRLVAS